MPRSHYVVKMNFFFVFLVNVTLTKLTNNLIKELPDAIYKCNKLCILDMKEMLISSL